MVYDELTAIQQGKEILEDMAEFDKYEKMKYREARMYNYIREVVRLLEDE